MKSQNKDDNKEVKKRSIDDPYVVQRLSFLQERNATNYMTLFNPPARESENKEKEKAELLETYNRFRT